MLGKNRVKGITGTGFDKWCLCMYVPDFASAFHLILIRFSTALLEATSRLTTRTSCHPIYFRLSYF